MEIFKRDLVNVSASPHDRSMVTTSSIMRDVVIALIPASAFGVYRFGFRAFLVLLTAMAAAVASEFLWNFFMKKPTRPYECSALVTGLLLGMNLPATIPLWMPAVGSAFAIIVVKQMYGGLGSNFMNPALAARCFLLICFAGAMTNFTVPQGDAFMYGSAGLDAVSSATPLAVLKDLPAAASVGESVSLSDMFFGFTGGVIGETSVAAILLGAVYLLARRVISIKIPVSYLLTFVVFVLLFGGRGFDPAYLAAQLMGGGLMLGVWFMATDYVTSPITPAGQVVYGILLGIMTGLIRICGNSAEGVSFAIIFCNLLVPIIEKLTMPRAFGTHTRHKARKGA